MYLRDCLIENVGPIELLDITMQFNEDGTPKPLIIVGKNGSGKSILLSYIVDALIEFAKSAFRDIVNNQNSFSAPYFKLIGSINQRMGSNFSLGYLRFLEKDKTFYYFDKTGSLDSITYIEKMPERFKGIEAWPNDGFKKYVSQNEKESFDKIYRSNSICYFPSSRNEPPHWLNISSVSREPSFDLDYDKANILSKPIFIEHSVEENKKWILDVFLDSKVDLIPAASGASPYTTRDNMAEKNLLKQSRLNIEALLKEILNDDIVLALNYRNSRISRLCISKDNMILIPSLDHLSSGQAILFNLFATIIRYSDRNDINKSVKLNEIEGIAVIDEVDAHLHSDLQYIILPKIIKLFPKVQFILTTHSPLFLLGMERLYGSDRIQIIEMPSGRVISSERFSEFEQSFNFLKETKAYEEEVEQKIQQRLQSSNKPMVLTEGETDPIYIKAAFKALNRSDLLANIDIEFAGTRRDSGSAGSGNTALNKIWTMYKAQPKLLRHKLLLLYDCDTNRIEEDNGLIYIRVIPKTCEDNRLPKGIENLLPASLLEEASFKDQRNRFYTNNTTVGDYMEKEHKEHFNKMEFCTWICNERKNSQDFSDFQCIISICDAFLTTDGASTS